MKIRILKYILVLGSLISWASSNGVTDLPCEKVILSYQNYHDTSKVVFEGRVVFDTTANQVSGKVVDRKALRPIANAIITMKKGARNFIDSTDGDGMFSIIQNDFDGVWVMTVTHPNFECLVIDSIMVGGGQDLLVKLK